MKRHLIQILATVVVRAPETSEVEHALEVGSKMVEDALKSGSLGGRLNDNQILGLRVTSQSAALCPVLYLDRTDAYLDGAEEVFHQGFFSLSMEARKARMWESWDKWGNFECRYNQMLHIAQREGVDRKAMEPENQIKASKALAWVVMDQDEDGCIQFRFYTEDSFLQGLGYLLTSIYSNGFPEDVSAEPEDFEQYSRLLENCGSRTTLAMLGLWERMRWLAKNAKRAEPETV